jgi:hypothetical protein
MGTRTMRGFGACQIHTSYQATQRLSVGSLICGYEKAVERFTSPGRRLVSPTAFTRNQGIGNRPAHAAIAATAPNSRSGANTGVHSEHLSDLASFGGQR